MEKVEKFGEKYMLLMRLVGLILIIAFTGGGIYVASDYFVTLEERPTWIVSTGIDTYAMLICVILYVSTLLERSLNPKNRGLARLFFMICVQLYVDILGWVYVGRDPAKLEMCYFLYKFLLPFTIIGYWDYLRAELELPMEKCKIRTIIIYAECFTTMMIIASNWFNHKFYYITDDIQVAQLPAFKWLDFHASITFGVIIYTIFTQKLKSYHKRILLSYITFPFAAYIIESFSELSLFYPFMLISTILIYTQVYLNRGKVIAEQETTLSKQSIALMMSQIQPHFLYNTLTTISNLCRKDPKEAEEVTVMFSHYLRMNLDSLKKLDPVPFAMELQHVQVYLELEKKRFGDQLNVEYDIKAQNFKVPALGLQPIAENSVKHGIREKEGTGTLRISSEELDKCFCVVIEDDGVGFDMNAPAKDDGRSHVGMSNVVDRLKKMCNADTEIISSPGNGCKTIITFPKENK